MGIIVDEGYYLLAIMRCPIFTLSVILWGTFNCLGSSVHEHDGHKLFEQAMAAGASESGPSALVSELNDPKLHSSFLEKIANREKTIQLKRLRRQKLHSKSEFANEKELLQVPELVTKHKAHHTARKIQPFKKHSVQPESALTKELNSVGLHTSFVKQLTQRSKSIKLRRKQLSLQRRLRDLRKDAHVTKYIKLHRALRKLLKEQHALGNKPQKKVRKKVRKKRQPETKVLALPENSAKLALTQVMISSKKESKKVQQKIKKELKLDREVKKEDGLNIQPPSQKNGAAHLHGKQGLVASISSSMVLIAMCKWH